MFAETGFVLYFIISALLQMGRQQVGLFFNFYDQDDFNFEKKEWKLQTHISIIGICNLICVHSTQVYN